MCKSHQSSFTASCHQITQETVAIIITITSKNIQGWLSPTERASVSAISLRHNLATSGESRRYVVAFTRFAVGGIWSAQESLRHILASPGYAPGTIAVTVTWLERGFNACSSIPIYLQPFTSYSEIYWSEIATFSYLPCI